MPSARVSPEPPPVLRAASECPGGAWFDAVFKDGRLANVRGRVGRGLTSESVWITPEGIVKRKHALDPDFVSAVMEGYRFPTSGDDHIGAAHAAQRPTDENLGAAHFAQNGSCALLADLIENPSLPVSGPCACIGAVETCLDELSLANVDGGAQAKLYNYLLSKWLGAHAEDPCRPIAAFKPATPCKMEDGGVPTTCEEIGEISNTPVFEFGINDEGWWSRQVNGFWTCADKVEYNWSSFIKGGDFFSLSEKYVTDLAISLEHQVIATMDLIDQAYVDSGDTSWYRWDLQTPEVNAYHLGEGLISFSDGDSQFWVPNTNGARVVCARIKAMTYSTCTPSGLPEGTCAATKGPAEDTNRNGVKGDDQDLCSWTPATTNSGLWPSGSFCLPVDTCGNWECKPTTYQNPCGYTPCPAK